MGPRPTVHERKGVLYQTVFDKDRGQFVERALPRQGASTRHSATTALNGSAGKAPLAPVDLSRVTRVLQDTEVRLRAAHASHLGYPYNLVGKASVPASFDDLLINNLGDPYVGSHYGTEVCALEREAVRWLMDLWDCDDPEAHWGSIGASGTEGNFWALYLAREALPEARLIYSKEAHYSIPKAAKILRMEAVCVSAGADGAIDLTALENALTERDRKNGIIVALTCGTTVKGAHDDIGGAVRLLEDRGFAPDRRFVHVDGALNAMVLPFLEGPPSGILPSFRHGIDSLSTSGHKMIGTPMPCGVLIARRSHLERVATAIAYLRSNDTTLMGSRNGHAVLAIWARLLGHGFEGYRRDATGSYVRAQRLAATLRSQGIPVLHNAYSLTVVFPEPSDEIVRLYQLACSAGEAHAVIMPNIGDAQLAQFEKHYCGWWESHRAAPGRPEAVRC